MTLRSGVQGAQMSKFGVGRTTVLDRLLSVMEELAAIRAEVAALRVSNDEMRAEIDELNQLQVDVEVPVSRRRLRVPPSRDAGVSRHP